MLCTIIASSTYTELCHVECCNSFTRSLRDNWPPHRICADSSPVLSAVLGYSTRNPYHRDGNGTDARLPPMTPTTVDVTRLLVGSVPYVAHQWDTTEHGTDQIVKWGGELSSPTLKRHRPSQVPSRAEQWLWWRVNIWCP